MSGDSYSSKGRNVLGDVTNRPLKRGSSVILDDADSKSRDVKGMSRAVEDGDSEFANRVCSGVENLLREKLMGKDREVGVEKIVSFLKGRGDLDVSSTRCRAQMTQDDPPPSVSEPTHSPEGLDTSMLDNVVPVGDDECREERVTPVASLVTENLVPGGSVADASREADKDLRAGKLASNKFGSTEWSRLPVNSQGGSFELERCKLLKDSDARNVCQGNDPLSGCSCSFCLKAAYIWSDLHYQDIKGRIAALRKSQKEASALVHKFGKGKDIDAIVSRNTSKPSELESNLFNQWKSLFLHMEGVLSHEGNQLQTNYIALKDLRENCKMDLEAINRMPLNKD
ncbi:uncharacterized protein LOC116200674 isoform X2 [Punica granatum]|uniref:Uncharacterized protein LOC116200674 isoform X2 n=2 Tax=Punica granatum TaxID=22663 RepID=A0A6P8CRZ7_PUNGR|nr:uncharacterized protein LOC116200674 isoform X2 [Punica granatum]PKI61198.1 hypothetical protein CRG98_018429 [Punica granatum]